MCPQAASLLRRSNQAALEFSKALCDLLQALESNSGGHYSSLRESVKLARKESTLSYQATGGSPHGAPLRSAAHGDAASAESSGSRLRREYFESSGKVCASPLEARHGYPDGLGGSTTASCYRMPADHGARLRIPPQDFADNGNAQTDRDRYGVTLQTSMSDRRTPLLRELVSARLAERRAGQVIRPAFLAFFLHAKNMQHENARRKKPRYLMVLGLCARSYYLPTSWEPSGPYKRLRQTYRWSRGRCSVHSACRNRRWDGRLAPARASRPS